MGHEFRRSAHNTLRHLRENVSKIRLNLGRNFTGQWVKFYDGYGILRCK